ncbi:hypothetical protein ACFXDE_15920 [Kitasatospora sp. NPDC059408]|uniref:hypothetical protein n=1 Tax=Kitasatospora sp. NPDC059408 TaxID=3346823 RepID=UPI00369EC8DF
MTMITEYPLPDVERLTYSLRMVTHPMPYVAKIVVSVPNFMQRNLTTWEPWTEIGAPVGGHEVTSCEELHGVLRAEGMSVAQTMRRLARGHAAFRLEARETVSGRLVGLAEWTWCRELGQYRQWDVFTGCEWGEHGWLPTLLASLTAEDGPTQVEAA